MQESINAFLYDMNNQSFQNLFSSFLISSKSYIVQDISRL